MSSPSGDNSGENLEFHVRLYLTWYIIAVHISHEGPEHNGVEGAGKIKSDRVRLSNQRNVEKHGVEGAREINFDGAPLGK